MPIPLPYVVSEMVAAVLLLASAAVAGALFARRPWPNRLDVVGYHALPANPDSPLYHHIAEVGSLPVLLIGIAVAICLSIWRDLPRAIACAIGPVAAVLLTEQIAKPLTHRQVTLYGGYSYPSGTVTAAAALMTVFVLASPKLLRPFVGLAGSAVVVAVCAAVVAMRWHYPTDAIGGILVGVGAVLFLDAVLHLPGGIRRDLELRRTRRDPHAPTFADAFLQKA